MAVVQGCTEPVGKAKETRRVAMEVPPRTSDNLAACDFSQLPNPKEAFDKWAFTRHAVSQPGPFELDAGDVGRDVLEAVSWICERTDEEVMSEREAMTAYIESVAKEYWGEGVVSEWMQRADPDAEFLCCSVRTEVLAARTGFVDEEAPNLFRDGANMIGWLRATGIGTPHMYPAPSDGEALLASRYERNCRLLETLSADKHAVELVKQMEEDAKVGRMSQPVPIEQVDLQNVLLASRFGVEQGVREDGTPKIRAVDNETDNGLNEATSATEKNHNDSLDMLFVVVRLLFVSSGLLPLLWKADIDAAYRRCPARPEHRDLLWVAVMLGDQIWASRHTALPFGCKSSVFAWNRIGAMLCHFARKLLHLPVFRFVDDFFSADRPGCAHHALDCFARITRAILGKEALQERKMKCGSPLSVLGVDICFEGFVVKVWPTEDKVKKYLAQLDHILKDKRLFAGEAS